MSNQVATERLFFDADKTKLVAANDPDAKILAAAVGDEIPDGFKAPAGSKVDAEKFAADKAQAEEEAAKAAAEATAAAAKAVADQDEEAAAPKAAPKPASTKKGSTPSNKGGVTVTKEPK